MRYSQFVTIVGNYGNPQRILSFLSSIAKCKGINETTLIVVNSKERNKNIDTIVRSYVSHFQRLEKIDIGIDEPITPSKQMMFRFEALKKYCQEDSIVCNFDDDYCFHSDWLIMAKNIFTNVSVNYLSLLRPYASVNFPVVNLNGKEFILTDTCMGGSFITRWSHFHNHMNMFLDEYGIRNDYDNVFWNIPSRIYCKKYFVYMLNNRSMYQHCNFGSQYGREGHMYGENFSL